MTIWSISHALHLSQVHLTSQTAHFCQCHHLPSSQLLAQSFGIIFPSSLFLMPYIQPLANTCWLRDYLSLNSGRISIKVSRSVGLSAFHAVLPTPSVQGRLGRTGISMQECKEKRQLSVLPEELSNYILANQKGKPQGRMDLLFIQW